MACCLDCMWFPGVVLATWTHAHRADAASGALQPVLDCDLVCVRCMRRLVCSHTWGVSGVSSTHRPMGMMLLYAMHHWSHTDKSDHRLSHTGWPQGDGNYILHEQQLLHAPCFHLGSSSCLCVLQASCCKQYAGCTTSNQDMACTALSVDVGIYMYSCIPALQNRALGFDVSS